jgi:hypothetical protein
VLDLENPVCNTRSRQQEPGLPRAGQFTALSGAGLHIPSSRASWVVILLCYFVGKHRGFAKAQKLLTCSGFTGLGELLGTGRLCILQQ